MWMKKFSARNFFAPGHENTDVGRKSENVVYETQG
jgi:hypothetical protein